MSTDISTIEVPEGLDPEELDGRSMIVRKCEVVPIECVVRGYLVGSGWRDYQRTSRVCGIELPAGLPNCAKFDDPLFTPATKAEEGHDENISFEQMADLVGKQLSKNLGSLVSAFIRRVSRLHDNAASLLPIQNSNSGCLKTRFC